MIFCMEVANRMHRGISAMSGFVLQTSTLLARAAPGPPSDIPAKCATRLALGLSTAAVALLLHAPTAAPEARDSYPGTFECVSSQDDSPQSLLPSWEYEVESQDIFDDPAPLPKAGVVDGLLRDCQPSTFACVSSQDDSPRSFLPPWEYEGDAQDEFDSLCLVIVESGGTLLESSFPYIRATFDETDEVELYFTPGDYTVQFRADGLAHPRFDFFRNRQRMEHIRIRAGLQPVPVLRGRQRLIPVFETPFDSFGPSAPGVDDLIEYRQRVARQKAIRREGGMRAWMMRLFDAKPD